MAFLIAYFPIILYLLEMPKTFTPELIKIIKHADCMFMRNGKGDHQIWYSPITDRNFVVDAAIKSRHTANAVLKQAGLPKAF
jgi:hypothetical protein